MDMSFLRQPKNRTVLAQAIRIWLECNPDPKVDICLLEHLEHQGVITMNERVGAYLEPQLREHGLVGVFLDQGDLIQITKHGFVAYFPIEVPRVAGQRPRAVLQSNRQGATK